jgi:hypothetical protein
LAAEGETQTEGVNPATTSNQTKDERRIDLPPQRVPRVR